MKKGAYDFTRTVLYYIIVLFFITAMFLTLHSVIYNSNKAFVENMDETFGKIMINKALISSSCFAYHNEKIDRTYPGIIDFEKFNEEQLKKCLKYYHNDLMFRIEDKQIGKGSWGTWERSKIPIVLKKGDVYKETFLEYEIELIK